MADQPYRKMQFFHERLAAYPLAVSVAHWIRAQEILSGDVALRDQARRASQSIVLNIAEGAGRQRGRASANHFRIAIGSAAELSAILDLFPDLLDGAEQQAKLRRIVATLYALCQKNQ